MLKNIFLKKLFIDIKEYCVMYNHNFYQLQGFSVFLFEEINFSFGKIQRIFLKKFVPVLEKYNFFFEKISFPFGKR